MSERKPLRILAVGAHPDDIETTCAGTLARCVQRGDIVTMAIVCRGESASSNLPQEKLIEVRSQEAKASAQLLGAELIEMGLSDGSVEITKDTKCLFTDVIRRADPDVIITHYYKDYGSDHNNAFALTLDATVFATVPNFHTLHPATARIPLLYMMEPLGGFDFQPQVYVDITETFTTKLKMLECHRSQIEWMSRYSNMDFRKYIEVVARFRGYQSRVELAEGFIPHGSWAHIPTGSVLP